MESKVALEAEVILEVQPSMRSLWSDLPGVGHVMSRGEPIPRVDVECPLMSLPLVLGTKPSSIPASQGYLHPDESRMTVRTQGLFSTRRPLIGICCRSYLTGAGDSIGPIRLGMSR